MRAAREHANALACGGESRRDQATDRSCASDTDACSVLVRGTAHRL
jgi:hypothetical protein